MGGGQQEGGEQGPVGAVCNLQEGQPLCQGKGEEETETFHGLSKETFALWGLPPPCEAHF